MPDCCRGIIGHSDDCTVVDRRGMAQREREDGLDAVIEDLDALDMVNHPPHYKQGGIETIDVIEAWGLDFCLGNTVKYISRAGKKGDTLEDLKKARWYLDREISNLEGG